VASTTRSTNSSTWVRPRAGHGRRRRRRITRRPKRCAQAQLEAPEGFEQWLIKLDGVGDPTSVRADPSVTSQEYCRVEYAYYLMAQRANIAMSPSFLLPEGPRAHFMTKRFDRGAKNLRLHLQSLCALDHLDFNLARTHSYSSYSSWPTDSVSALRSVDRYSVESRST